MAKKSSTNPRTLLTPAGLHILMSLADGVRHGYGVKRDVEEATGGKLHLGPGTLYEAIHRMVAQGWIEEVDGEEFAADYDARRKYYTLTEEGRGEMENELERLDAVLEHARAHALMPRRRAAP